MAALDISRTFIRASRDADPTGRYICGDGSSLPFADATFDAARRLVAVLDHPSGQHHSSAQVDRRRRRVRTWLAIGDYFVEGPMTDSWTFKAANEMRMQTRHEPFFLIVRARR